MKWAQKRCTKNLHINYESLSTRKKKKADFPTCVKIGKTTREHRFLLANCLTDPGIQTTEENQENHKRTSILAKKIVLNCWHNETDLLLSKAPCNNFDLIWKELLGRPLIRIYERTADKAYNNRTKIEEYEMHKSMFWICDILVRIQIRESVPLT